MVDLLFETLIKAGNVIYFIFFVSVYAWFLIIKKYSLVKAEGRDARHFVKNVSGYLNNRGKGDLKNFLKGENRILARELERAVDTGDGKKFGMEIDRARISYHEILDSDIGTIGTLSAIAPLLGLLGTVIGMMKTFGVIKLFGSANPALMAEGISEALLTTQAGLVVAFPIVLANTFIKNRIKEIKDNFEKIYMKIKGDGNV